MNKHTRPSFSLQANCRINVESPSPVPQSSNSLLSTGRFNIKTPSPVSQRSKSTNPSPNLSIHPKRSLFLNISTLTAQDKIQRLVSAQDKIHEFVIPTRKMLKPRPPTMTATAELMTYLGAKEVQDYNLVIKKEMLGENVTSVKRKVVYDNLKEFEVNNSFPRDPEENMDCEQSQQDTNIIGPGSYKFNFDFVLPKNLPSSYESQIGYIRYLIHATIERPWAFDRHEKKYFSVIEILDLNRLPLVESGTKTADRKTFCCLCCKSDPISASLSLTRRGYVPGETIVFDAKIHNRSSRTIKESRASLVMQVLYHTSSRTWTSNHVLAKTKHGQIEGNGQEIWTQEKLKIPAVPPSYLKFCEIIDIQYLVEIKITPKGPGSPFKIQSEIIVGTVPLKSSVEKFRAPLIGTSTPSPTNYDAVHVMFAESALGRVYNKSGFDKREISCEIDFVPLYGYFLSDSRDSASIFTVSSFKTGTRKPEIH